MIGMRSDTIALKESLSSKHVVPPLVVTGMRVFACLELASMVHGLCRSQRGSRVISQAESSRSHSSSPRARWSLVAMIRSARREHLGHCLKLM